MGALWYLHQPQ